MVDDMSTRVETKILDLIHGNQRLITAAEVAHRLEIPLEKLAEYLDGLKNAGAIREARIEDIIAEGK